MPRIISSAVLAAIVAVGALTSTASAAEFDTKVVIRESPPIFHGKVKSEKPKCLELRKVKVFKKTNQGNVKQGKDLTNAEGKWVVPVAMAKGNYFAKVTERTQGNTTCLKGKSEIIHVD